MKEVFFKTTKWASLFMLVFGMTVFTGCKDDEPEEEVIETPVEDGIYVRGSATDYGDDFNIKALMSSTKNEIGQQDRPELMEVFIALEAGGTFQITEVAGSARTNYGPSGDWAVVAGGANDEPANDFEAGDIAEGATTFTVAADGLYHVVWDTEVNRGAVISVPFWGLIGAATPGGWGSDTQLMPSSFDHGSMTFSATEVAMTLADYKFRYGGGWKVTIDTNYVNPPGLDNGIKVNSNYGDAVDALVAGGDNINNTIQGLYTATVTWTAGEGFTAEMVKTGDISVDYTGVNLGMIGDGIMVAGVQWAWDNGHELHNPVNTGDIHTWTWNDIEVTTAGSFKLREGDNWDGYVVGFPQVTMAGDGAADFDTNADGNFVPLVDGTVYDFTYVIDQTDPSAETFTFTAIIQ